MHYVRSTFLITSALALGLAGCASSQKFIQSTSLTASATQDVVDIGIAVAQRAVPTIKNNVIQPAHYEHVYIDTLDETAGSLKTITLQDAVANDVLASSDLQVKSLNKVATNPLRWTVLEDPIDRPKLSEGVGGAGFESSSFSVVNFSTNETQVLDTTKLDGLLKLASRIDGTFYIVGYSDATGVEVKNQTLSKARAQSVADLLLAGGVGTSHIKVFSGGVSQTYESLAANRRASVTFQINN
jgi:outer membrane protein OmpA-like peptidoglycan-associated protein